MTETDTAFLANISAAELLMIFGALVIAVMILGAFIGFMSARAHYRGRIEERATLYAGEVARLRRQISATEARNGRLKLEIDRARRRAAYRS